MLRRPLQQYNFYSRFYYEIFTRTSKWIELESHGYSDFEANLDLSNGLILFAFGLNRKRDTIA